MAAAIDLYAYQEPILFLATAGIVVPLFHRLRISPVLGFLGAGALLGPLRAWAADGRIRVGQLAHLHAAGGHLASRRIRRGVPALHHRHRAVLAAPSHLAAAGLRVRLPAGAAVHRWPSAPRLPLRRQPSRARPIVGLALALSSTAIVIPVMAEQKRLKTPAGRASFSALIFQDLAVAPILFTLAVLDTGQPEVTAASFSVGAAAGGRCAGR